MQDAIIISVSTIAAGVVGLIVRYLFRSKCEDVNCCFGCLKFHRDVKSEKEVVERQESVEEEVKST